MKKYKKNNTKAKQQNQFDVSNNGYVDHEAPITFGDMSDSM